MNHTFRSTKGALLLACVLVGGTPMAWAQNQPASTPAPSALDAGGDSDASTKPSADNQLVERLHHEDQGNSIDELRIGGRTKNVTVTPKNGAPSYEIVPNDPARNITNSNTDTGGPAGRRVWKFGTF